MTKRLLGLVAVVALAAPAAAQDEAKKVIDKAVTAHGGADLLKKFQAGKATMKGEMTIIGMDLTYDGTVKYELPDKFKLEIEGSFVGQAFKVSQVSNGDKIQKKVTAAGKEMTSLTDEEKEEIRMTTTIQDITHIYPLLNDKKYSLKAEADGDVDGKKAAVVKVTVLDNSKTVSLFFDKESGLLIKTQRKGKGPTADGSLKEVDEESFLSDYKKVNGMMVAMKTTVKHDGSKFMAFTFDDVELLESLPKDTFKTND